MEPAGNSVSRYMVMKVVKAISASSSSDANQVTALVPDVDSPITLSASMPARLAPDTAAAMSISCGGRREARGARGEGGAGARVGGAREKGGEEEGRLATFCGDCAGAQLAAARACARRAPGTS